MNVNVEFLANDAIENCITNLNYRMDKNIYFGYKGVWEQRGEKVTEFLEDYCGMRNTEFVEVPYTDLDEVIKRIRDKIKKEVDDGNRVFFDITGGESLVLVASGVISMGFEIPIHMYDTVTGHLYEYNTGAQYSIKDCPEQSVLFDIDTYISMCGGGVKYNMQKKFKENSAKSDDMPELVDAMFELQKRYQEEYLRPKKRTGVLNKWNVIIEFLGTIFNANATKQVDILEQDFEKFLKKKKWTDRLTVKDLDTMFLSLASMGAIKYKKNRQGMHIECRNSHIAHILTDYGSLLEMYVYLHLKESGGDCRIGINLDWDGVLHPGGGLDVYNEVDVMKLDGYVPTFISCKAGKMDNEKPLRALYELETVASHFADRHAKKILVTMQDIGQEYAERAANLGIKVLNAMDEDFLEKLG